MDGNTGIVPLTDGSITAPRRMPLVGEVEAWVKDMVADSAMREADFTAYGITTALRANHPGVEIIHDLVRATVESVAPTYGYSVSRWEMFPNGEWARIWEPTPQAELEDEDAELALVPVSTPLQLLPGVDPV